jgi:hypothetical protein
MRQPLFASIVRKPGQVVAQHSPLPSQIGSRRPLPMRLAPSPTQRARVGRRCWPVAVFITPAARSRGAICSNLSSLRTSVRYVHGCGMSRSRPLHRFASRVGSTLRGFTKLLCWGPVTPAQRSAINTNGSSKRGAFIARSTKRGPLARQSCRATCPAASRMGAGSAGRVLCGPAPVRSPAASCFPPRRAFRAYPTFRARTEPVEPGAQPDRPKAPLRSAFGFPPRCALRRPVSSALGVRGASIEDFMSMPRATGR